MNREIVRNVIADYVTESLSIEVNINDLVREKKHLKYNKMIREIIESNRYGVYLLRDSITDEILYIGMAGKISNAADNKNNKHDLRRRLVASRGKDNDGKDITTSDFLKKKMRDHDIESLTIEVFFSNDKTAPLYIEALLLQRFWELSGFANIPKWNKSF